MASRSFSCRAMVLPRRSGSPKALRFRAQLCLCASLAARSVVYRLGLVGPNGVGLAEVPFLLAIRSSPELAFQIFDLPRRITSGCTVYRAFLRSMARLVAGSPRGWSIFSLGFRSSWLFLWDEGLSVRPGRFCSCRRNSSVLLVLARSGHYPRQRAGYADH
jgi:hypothetical protein